MILTTRPFLLLLWILGFVETSSLVISPTAVPVPSSNSNFRGFRCMTHKRAASTSTITRNHGAYRSFSSTPLSVANFQMMPLWPYIGCSGECGGGPLGLFLALTLCGVGLPISEDVLLIGLAPRLFWGINNMTLFSKLLYFVAAVFGVATTDTITLSLGRALRTNSDVLGEKAPMFLRAMLVAIQRQLVTESQRDGARLQEQLTLRLRVATLDLKDRLRRFIADFNSKQWKHSPQTNSQNEPSSSMLWKRLKASNTWIRRITCNTRTSLAAWGQESSSVTKRVASRILSQNDDATLLLKDPSFLAGMDNRLAVGQRWPLALLSGFSFSEDNLDYGRYFVGASLAALAVTLPVQLVLGAALRDWARKVLYILIATAQLCRYGPIWATVFTAIGETVRTEIETVKARKQQEKSN